MLVIWLLVWMGPLSDESRLAMVLGVLKKMRYGRMRQRGKKITSRVEEDHGER